MNTTWTTTLLTTLLTAATSTPASAAPVATTLTDPSVRFTVPDTHHVILKRGPVTAVVVDNHPVDTPRLPGHRAGYNGLASLTHSAHPNNVFVPAYAGLNFEHIHDGSTARLTEKFEPRRFPMQLRIIDDFTVELHQPPTGNWKLESCARFHLLADGTIDYTFECIPRAADAFKNNFIGLFWASYINAPPDKSIRFIGQPRSGQEKPAWLQTFSPSHGTRATHAPLSAPDLPAIDPDFPLTLVNHPSDYLYTQPWFYGLTHQMALAFVFSPGDHIWFAQSPDGGGPKNPAWDFQWFIHNPEVNQAYQFTMRLAFFPHTSRDTTVQKTTPHLEALDRP